MPITQVGATLSSGAPTGFPSLSLVDAGHASGDYILISIVDDQGASQTLNPLPGALSQLSHTVTSASDGSNQFVIGGFLNGTETSLAFQYTSTNQMIVNARIWRGVDPTTPLDVAVVAQAFTPAGTTATLTIVPVTNDAVLCAFADGDTTGADTTFSYDSSPSLTWSADWDVRDGFYNSGAGFATIAAAASTDVTVTLGTSCDRHLAVVALRPAPILEQEGYRFGADDGAENAHTWIDAQDTPITQPASQNVILSVVVNVTGAPGARTFKLQHRKVGDTTWLDTPLQ